MRNIACNDCVVTVLLNIKPLPGKTAEFSQQDQQVITDLASAGMVPPLRFRKGQTAHLKAQKMG